MPNNTTNGNTMTNLKQISNEVNFYANKVKSCFIGLDAIVDLMLVGLIIEKNVALIGPPGEGKTAIIETFSKGLDMKSWAIQVNQETTQDELIGHFSLKEMEQNDELVRKTAGKLGDCELAYIDEFANASGGTMNGLLKAINEKEIDKGNGAIEKIPLQMAIGSTNFNISHEEKLIAFWDRWGLRAILPPALENAPVDDIKRFIRGVTGPKRTIGKMDSSIKLNRQVIEALRGLRSQVRISAEIETRICELVKFLNVRKSIISVRRLEWICYALQACALLDGRMEVTPADLSICNYMAWTHPEDIQPLKIKVSDLSMSANGELKKALKTIRWKIKEAKIANEEAYQERSPDKRKALQAKFDDIADQIDNTLADALKMEIPDNDNARNIIEDIKNLKNWKAEVN